ncbi:MAG: hypothetical protein Q4C70_07685, partial [Planctomycetia bacterium]|nr:hypothetical protein [Planctomycetia bacterium]
MKYTHTAFTALFTALLMMLFTAHYADTLYAQSEAEENTETVFAPQTATEIEIFPENNAGTPILPPDFVAEKLAACPIQIQRSYVPGVALESTHFLVEADSHWAQKADQLVRTVQTLEFIRNEAELTASLWRNPGETPKIADAKKTPDAQSQSTRNTQNGWNSRNAQKTES